MRVGLRLALHGTVTCRWAKQIWFISQRGVKSLKGSCYTTSAEGWARSQEKERIKGPWCEAAFTQDFLKHMPFSYKMKRGFYKWVFLVTVLISSNQISILWFIYSEFDEPFPQHCPASTSCAVHCHWWAVPSALPEHSCEHWRVAGAPLASPCTLTTPWCWVLLALCACQLKWHLVPYGNSPCSWNMGCVFGLDELPPQ